MKSNSNLPVNKEPDVIGAIPFIYVLESKVINLAACPLNPFSSSITGKPNLGSAPLKQPAPPFEVATPFSSGVG